MMINEIFASEVSGLLLRVTLIALVGYVGIVSCRIRFPSLSIVIARVLLVAIWMVPIAMLLDWSLDVAVLPAGVDSQNSELVEFVQAAETTSYVASMKDAAHADEAISAPTEGAAVAASVPAISSQLAARFASVSIAQWMYGLWILGATFFLMSFSFKWMQTIFCIRRSTSCEEQTADLAAGVADRLGITGPVAVRISNRIHGPCTAGWIRPHVLLPASWMQSMSNEQTKMILAHELTHAQYRDSAWDALARITTACWWFHPIVSAVTRQHRLACEHRCDAAATEVAGGSQSYRRQLAKWALVIRDSDRNAKLATLTALSMAERPLLLKRLNWLKNKTENRDVSARKKWSFAMVMAAFCTLVSIANPTQQLLASTEDQDGTVAQRTEQESKPTVNAEPLDSLLHKESKDPKAKNETALRSRYEAEFKDALNSFSEFRPSKYLELQELKIVSGGKTDKGDYLFVCDTKVVWLKSRKELMKMQVDFFKKFARQHNGSITALALVPMATQMSVIESTVPKFESGDIHSNRKIRVRGERAGDSIIVTSVSPSDFMVGKAGSAVDQLLQTIAALESNKLPTSAENATIELKVEHKEPQPAVVE